MIPGNYNFGTQYRGDTIDAIDVTLPIDLTGATVRIEFRLNTKTGEVEKTISSGNGITVNDAAAGEITIDDFKIETAGKIYWDLEVTTAAGAVKTYLNGSFNVLQDVTNTSSS